MSACSSRTAASSRSKPAIEAHARAGEGGGRGDPNRRHACARSSRTANGVRIETDGGDIEARPAIVAAGAWVTKLLARSAGAAARHAPGHGLVRAARSRAVRAGRFPVFLLESRHGMHYGFPPLGQPAREDRQASPPRRDGRSRTQSTATVSAGRRGADPPRARRPHPGGERPRSPRPRPASTP